MKHSTVSPGVFLSDCAANFLGWLVTMWRAFVFWTQRGERVRLRAEMDAARKAQEERSRQYWLEKDGDVETCRKRGLVEVSCGHRNAWKYVRGDKFDGCTIHAIDRRHDVLYIDHKEHA